jgi:hypothetical protein
MAEENTVKQFIRHASTRDRHGAELAHGKGRQVEVLCAKDREMMLEFSDLCVRRLNRNLSLKLFLSLFQQFFDSNVHKEIEKDRLVIERSVAGHEKGKDRTDIDVAELFEATKSVDADFMKKLGNPFFSMEIRYDDFAEIRKKRIASYVHMVFDLLCNWQHAVPFDDIVKNTFAEKRYREILGEVLHLYNVETRMLGNSIIFYGPAGRVKDLFAERLFTAMEQSAGDIVAAYARRVYAHE